MSMVVNSGLSHRLVTGAVWVLGIAGAVAWLAAFVYELQAMPQRAAAGPIQYASSPAAQPAHATQAEPPATYWTEVGRAAGSH
jgi:hypothetical protein